MIITHSEHDNAIGFELKDNVTRNNVKEIEPKIEEFRNKKGKINMLLLVNDFKGKDLKGDIEFFRFCMKNWRKFNRVAIVGNKKWKELLTKVDNLTGPWHEKYFNSDQLDEAWQWVEEKI